MTAPTESPAELFKLLGANPKGLIGQCETGWLDFKAEVYLPPNNTTEVHRWELAKDVSAMANAGGGVILVGVSTVLEESVRQEIAHEIRPIPQALLDMVQIQKIIHEWVYPRLDVEILLHDVPGAPGKLLTLQIPRQHDRDLPFVVVGEVEEGKRKRWRFGLYRRVSTDNAPVTPQQVQQWLHDGYTVIEEKAGSVAGSHSESDLNSLADDILAADRAVLDDKPEAAYYFVQCVPAKVVRLESFFQGDADSVWDTMLRLSHVREQGFGLPSHSLPERGLKNAHRIVAPYTSSISVLPNGLMTAVLDEHTMCWAGDKYARAGEVIINPLSLPEFTLEACQFFLLRIMSRVPETKEYLWRIGMGGVDGKLKLLLPRGSLQTLMFRDHGGQEPERGENFVEPWERSVEQEAERMAFVMVSGLYGHFHLGSASIIYADKERISADKIRKQEY